MKITNKTFFYMLTLITINLMFSACSMISQEVKAKPDVSNEKISLSKLLTPIQKCKKVDNKYNLIVTAPLDSRVRILNIKPTYKDCIALENGRYHIEVTKAGFKKYKRWITLVSDIELHVELKRLGLTKMIKLRDDSINEVSDLKDAGYSTKKLKAFIRKYPKSNRTLMAKNRLGVIKHKFKSYSPNGLIRIKSCVGIYPKKLVEKKLDISTRVEYWKSIEWSGSCKKSLMSGRGSLYFKSDNGISVKLKGKMKNGFFEGRVYNHSNTKDNNSAIKSDGEGYDNIKLKNRFDFMHYQE